MSKYKSRDLEFRDLIFDAKPDPVPYNNRISYKVPQICLIIYLAKKEGGSSLIEMSLISFALICSENMEKIIKLIDEPENSPIGCYDPGVYEAIKFAILYGLVKLSQFGNFKLTGKGKSLVSKMNSSRDIMMVEKSKIIYLVKKLSDDKVKRIIRKWGT
jgi:hypothetical protein